MAITFKKVDGIEQTRLTTINHLDDAAAPVAASYPVGYKARAVTVDNVTDRIKFEWYEGMPSGHAVQTVAAGTRTLITTGGVAVSGNDVGFAVLQSKQYRVRVVG